ncbi:hypothetical protein SEUCBS139899_010823 [Sporothrix eucalyptigena]
MSATVFLITGASSGFGKAIALEALRRGHKVIATARDASKLGQLKEAGAAVLDLDVAAGDESVAAAFQKAHAIYGRLTHVVNAAGYVLEGAIEESSQAEVAAIFATNVFGASATVRAAAPYLRQAVKQDGAQTAIASFGSMAGWEPTPAVALYCATKAADSMIMQGAALELKPFGIDAVTIEPGYFRTELLNSGTGVQRKITTAQTLDVYINTPVEAVRNSLVAADNNQLGDVTKAARVIVDVLTRSGVAKGRSIPTRLVLGSDCVDKIRELMAETEKSIKEWEAVSRSTDHDQ